MIRNTKAREQLALDLRLRADATFGNFISAPGQKETILALRSFADGEGEEQQWFLWGARQTGKTHLAQAACHEAAKQGLPAAYLPDSLLLCRGPEFLTGMDHLRLVVLDDVHRLWAIEEWVRALFALINRAREHHLRLLFTAEYRPELEVLADLRTRLLWGPVCQLVRLDDLGIQKLWQHGALIRGFRIGEAEVVYLLHHGPREPRLIVQLLDYLDRNSLCTRRRITIPFIRRLLNEPFPDSK